jgi:glycosyltransferase involved in cell wall biosynthesis
MLGPVSVVIPAHNESAVIADMLRRLLDTDPEERLEIVVAANGCTDDTAAVAAAVSPRVRVIEIETPSKIAALNAGDVAAMAFPRAYVDADVRVTGEALLAVADALAGPPFIGAPRMEIDEDGASLPVRWQYRVWDLTDYRNSAMVGSGVYVLSKAGRARFGRFPDIIADDMYALRLFTPEERISVRDHVFTVRTPSTLRAFIRRQARIIAGNDELCQRYPELDRESGAMSMRALIGRVIRRPSLWLPAIPYFWARIVARRSAARVRGNWALQGWNRDESSRVASRQ